MTTEEYLRLTLGDMLLTIAQLRADVDRLRAEALLKKDSKDA